MAMEDIKEQLLVAWNRVADRVQEMPLYTQLKERFDGLAPSMQKVVVIALGALLWFIVMMVPLSWYQESQDSVTAFDERRSVMRELMKVSREAQDVPPLMPAPPVESLRADIESRLRSANLVPEQIKNIEVGGGASSLIPADRSIGSVLVNVWKLNIRQVVDVGTQLSRLNPSVKLTSTEISANKDDNHYFDVVFKLTALAVPDLTAPPPEEPVKPARGGRNRPAKGDE